MSSLYTSTLVGSGLLANMNTTTGASLNTSADSGLDMTGFAQESLNQEGESNDSGADENQDLYETEMISSEVEFTAQQSMSQTSVLVSQDVNKSGLLAILEDDIQFESTLQSSQLNPQTITTQVNDRSY